MLDEGDDDPGFRGEYLLRVIVVPSGGAWLEGWKIQSVELYADGVVVRGWSGEGFRADDERPARWMIEDDLGTRYGSHADGSSWDEYSATRESEFEGAVPEAATVLTIRGQRESIQVELLPAP